MMTLVDFTLLPGETSEQALSRAIDYHLRDHRFTEILRHVNRLTLERDLDNSCSLPPRRRQQIEQLLQMCQPQPETMIKRIVCQVKRANLRRRLFRVLSSQDQRIVCDLEQYISHV